MTPQNSTIDLVITLPFSDPLLARIKETSPRLRITSIAARKVEDIPAETWARCEILYTMNILPTPEMAPSLRWVQFHTAGIDFVTDTPLLGRQDLTFTTLSGAAAPQMAEYVVMMLLALNHKIPEMSASQSKAEWPANRLERFLPRELRGSKVGIVGYGSVGRQIARVLQPFGVTILAAKRDAMRPEDTGYIQGGMGDPGGDFFDRLYPIEALPAMLKECDAIVVTLPLTPATRGIIDADALAVCKPSAFLIDVSRGGVIDPPALLNALQEKRLLGAALDVFAEEPLPASSPFWKLPNVIITPHISGISPQYNERAVNLFIENLNRYYVDLPLYNRFDPEIGY